MQRVMFLLPGSDPPQSSDKLRKAYGRTGYRGTDMQWGIWSPFRSLDSSLGTPNLVSIHNNPALHPVPVLLCGHDISQTCILSCPEPTPSLPKQSELGIDRLSVYQYLWAVFGLKMYLLTTLYGNVDNPQHSLFCDRAWSTWQMEPDVH